MRAAQGPGSVELVAGVTDHDVEAMPYYRCAIGPVLGNPARISRTGYTGEDGFELIVPSEVAVSVWERLMEADGAVACGLGCRDTLRLEAAMPLYGHELDEHTDPYTAGLGFAVKMEADAFIGREAVLAARDRDGRRRRVGLRLEGRRIAREGASVLSEQSVVGEVTSGTFSPTLEMAIPSEYVTHRGSTLRQVARFAGDPGSDAQQVGATGDVETLEILAAEGAVGDRVDGGLDEVQQVPLG